MQNNASKKHSQQYAELRARLIQRGFTLRSFAMQHGYSIPTVYHAARGLRCGIISTRIINHLNQIAYAK